MLLLAVGAGAEKHDHRPVGLHHFPEGEHEALAGQRLAELGYELLERPRPLRVARAVGEEDECSLVFSFGHVWIIFEAAASR